MIHGKKHYEHIFDLYLIYKLAQGHHHKEIIELPFFVHTILEILFKNICSKR